MGIEEIDVSLEAAREHVLGERAADRSFLVARADHGKRTRGKGMFEITDRHCRSRATFLPFVLMRLICQHRAVLKIQARILRQRCYGKRMTAATPAEHTLDWRALFENSSPAFVTPIRAMRLRYLPLLMTTTHGPPSPRRHCRDLPRR